VYENQPVFFIDDEQHIRQANVQTLELAGFQVQAFDNAEEALPQLGRDWPGVVVSDIRMPGMDGMQLLARAQEIDRDLPVILITGHGDVAMAVDAMRQGAYDFIEKPFSAERLGDTVRRALGRRCRRGRVRVEPAQRSIGQEHALRRALLPAVI